MKKSPPVLKTGTRPSQLARTQTRQALDRIERTLKDVVFEMVVITSTGDTDRTTDLRESPADFFTKELDTSLLCGEIDLAVHSAKDLPHPLPNNIQSFWLPWREDPRDVLVLPHGKTLADLSQTPIIGISSERREQYCSRRFPEAVQKNIRGNIEERIEQLDRGDFDIVIMASAALFRLGMEERITEWIPLEELKVPEGQGYLAVTYREGDERISSLHKRLEKLNPA
ncbi:MAG TPA: hydroxymethylbilane synthase [Pontiella sp.]